MSSFIEEVRNRQVLPPTGKGFLLSHWQQVQNDESRDESDRKFAEAGIFFFRQLEEVRSRLPETLSALGQAPTESIRLILGFANWNFRDIQAATDAIMQNSPNPAFFESRMLAENDDDVRGVVYIDDSLRVDTTSLIIRDLVKRREDQSEGSDGTPDAEVETRVKNAFYLAKVYTYIEELWSECLWANAVFDSKVKPPILRLRQSDWGKRSTICEYRIHSVRIEQTRIVAEPWRNPTDPRRKAPWLKPEITFREVGQVLHPEVADVPLRLGEFPMDVIHAEVYRRFYSENLLTRPLSALGNLAIKDLLVARRVLSALGKALQNRLLSDASLQTRESLLLAAPLISIRSLENALHRVLRNLSTKAIQTLLSLFVFGGARASDRDLWFRPLVHLGGDNLVALAEPLMGLNLELAVDDWSSQGNLYTEKGIQFEDRLRGELATIAESGRISDARVFRASVRKLETCRDACGDIDLLVKIGRTILVGEVKTLGFPARALGIYKNLTEIRKACRQALRKVKAVAECIEEVLQLTGFGSIEEQDDWKVLPFVLSNQAIGVGSSFDDVPVVDRQILESYLGQGGCYPTALIGPSGTILDSGPFKPYYDDDAQAEVRVAEYLRNPPAVRRYESFCEARRMPFNQLDDQIIVENVRLNLANLDATIPRPSA